MLLQIEHINNTCFLRLIPVHVMHSFLRPEIHISISTQGRKKKKE